MTILQTAMYGEAQAPFQDARGKIAQIDLSAMNITIEELRESLGTTASRTNSTSTKSIEVPLESDRDTGVSLSATPE